MDSTVLTDQIVKSLSFEVEAAPQKDSLFISSASNGVPVDIKIRVKRKKDAESKKIGFLSRVVKTRNKKRIRLVSSDQTIMSFNMLIETDDLDVDRNLHSKKYLFGVVKSGGCLDPKVDDEDDHQYLASSSKIKSRVENRLQHNKANSDIVLEDNRIKESISPISMRNKSGKSIFGKCKPGGCLDPHADDEENYSYKPNTIVAGSIEKPIKFHSSSKENIPVFQNYKPGGCLDPPFGEQEDEKDVYRPPPKEPIHVRLPDSELDTESNKTKEETNKLKLLPKEPIHPRESNNKVNAESIEFEEKSDEYKPLPKEPKQPQVPDSELNAKSNKFEAKIEQNIPSGQFKLGENQEKRSSIFSGKLFRKKKNSAVISDKLKNDSKTKNAQTHENSISNSIITYPPDLSPSEILDTTEQESSQPIEIRHAYYSPPRRSIRSKDEEHNKSEVTKAINKIDKKVNDKIEPTKIDQERHEIDKKTEDEGNLDINIMKGKNKYDKNIDEIKSNQQFISSERQIRLNSTSSTKQKDVDIVNEYIVISRTHSPVRNDTTNKFLTQSHSLTAIIQTTINPSSTKICIRSKTQVEEGAEKGSKFDLKIIRSISQYGKELDNSFQAKVDKPVPENLKSQVIGDDKRHSKLLDIDSKLLFNESQNNEENTDSYNISDANASSLPVKIWKSRNSQDIKKIESTSKRSSKDIKKGQINFSVENLNDPVTPNDFEVSESSLKNTKFQNKKDSSPDNVPSTVSGLKPISPRDKIQSQDNAMAEHIKIPDANNISEFVKPFFPGLIQKGESQKNIDSDELSSKVPAFRPTFPGDSENVNNNFDTLSEVKEPHIMNSVEKSDFPKHIDINNRKSGQDYIKRSSVNKQMPPEYTYDDVENLDHLKTNYDNPDYNKSDTLDMDNRKSVQDYIKRSSVNKQMPPEYTYDDVENLDRPETNYDNPQYNKSDTIDVDNRKSVQDYIQRSSVNKQMPPEYTYDDVENLGHPKTDYDNPEYNKSDTIDKDNRKSVQDYTKRSSVNKQMPPEYTYDDVENLGHPKTDYDNPEYNKSDTIDKDNRKSVQDYTKRSSVNKQMPPEYTYDDVENLDRPETNYDNPEYNKLDTIDIDNRKSVQDYIKRSCVNKQMTPEYTYDDVENLDHPKTNNDNPEYNKSDTIDVDNRKSVQDYIKRSSVNKQMTPEYTYDDVENLVHDETHFDNPDYNELDTTRDISTKEIHTEDEKPHDISPSFMSSFDPEENNLQEREVEDQNFPVYEINTDIGKQSLEKQKIISKELNKNEIILARTSSLSLNNTNDITIDQNDPSIRNFTTKNQSQSDDREKVQEFTQRTMPRSAEELFTSSKITQNNLDDIDHHLKSSDSFVCTTNTQTTTDQLMIDPNVIPNYDDRMSSQSSLSSKSRQKSDQDLTNKYLGKYMIHGSMDSNNILLTNNKNYDIDLKSDRTQINQRSYDETKYFVSNTEGIKSDTEEIPLKHEFVEPSQKNGSPNSGRLSPVFNLDRKQTYDAENYMLTSKELNKCQQISENHEIFAGEKSERHRSLHWQEEQTVGTLPSKEIDSDMLQLDLSFLNYTDEKGQKVFKSLDSSTIPLTRTKDITTFRTDIKKDTSRLSLKMDVDDNVSLMFFNKSTSKFEALPKAQLNLNKADVRFVKQADEIAFDPESPREMGRCLPHNVFIKKSSIKKIRDLDQNEVNLTLSSIYEEELVPLRNTIKSLKNEIDELVKRQNFIKDRIFGVKKTKSARLLRINRPCRCIGHKNVFIRQ